LEGVVTVAGRLDRWSATDITERLTRQVAGVVDVVNKLSYEYDDREARGVGLAYGVG
jgi:osmotically-inducible protein OsmY